MSLLDRMTTPMTLEESIRKELFGGNAPIIEKSDYSRNLPAQVNNPPPPQEKKGFFSRFREDLSDPLYRAKLASAFNSMRYSPSAAVDQNYRDMLALRQANKEANLTVQYLERTGNQQLADAVRANPQLATDAMKSIIGTNYAKQSSGIQTDPTTGQQYVTEYDPNTGVGRRVDVAGAIGETPAQKQQREAAALSLASDRDAAVTRGQDLFDNADSLQDSIKKLESARDLAAGGNIQVGAWRVERYLPSLSADDAIFRNIRKDLGIGVINSATFGALSEAELNLALSKDIPDSLTPEELVPYLDRQIAARRKLYREIMKKSRRLQSGIGLSEYIKEQDEQIQKHYQTLSAYPVGDPNMTYELWNEMTSEDRQAYLEADK